MDDRIKSLVSPEEFISFGELLRYLRRRARLTQRELSIQVGYSEPQISYLEKNHRLPDLATVAARFIPALDLDYDSPLAQRLIRLAEAAHIEKQSGVQAPYKGLHFFEVQDADLFYGRELLTARLVRHLRKHKFLAIVIGASGSGKSSVVRAGLVPAMQRGGRLADGSLPPPGSAYWKYYIFTPGPNPLVSLIAALDDSSEWDLSASIKDFTAEETHLDKKAEQILNPLSKSPGSQRDHIVLIVDQFEEVYTLCEDEETRRAFIDNLMYSASSQSRGFISVVIALRADFYAHCAKYPNLRASLAQYQEYIGPMNMDEIRLAIEQPALNAGLTFEPGLVDLILKDMGDEPGALPLLSHALLETWKRRKYLTLTFQGYNQSGGIRGAIAQTAENVYLKLDKEQQAAARRIFLSLTELGQTSEDGLLRPDTRRRVLLTDLFPDRAGSKTLESLLKLLSDARLIIMTESTVEVAHEALIREWPRLREWLSEDRESLLLHRQLNMAASAWEADERKQEYLYRGSRLSQALEWVEKHPGEPSAVEKAFLDASKSASEREIAEREAQRRKELMAAKKLAESETRRAEEHKIASQRLRQRAWVLGVLLLLASVLAGVAIGLGRQKDEAARLANSRELASASLNNLNVDPERSILLALEALSIRHTREAEEALHRAVFASRVEMTLRGHEGLVGVAVYSPDGSRIATAGEDGLIKIWDAESGEVVLTLSGHEGPVYEVIYSPSGGMIATAGEDGTARLWEATTGEVMIWNLHSGVRELALKASDQLIFFLAFSPDGKRLAGAGEDGSAYVWDALNGKLLLQLSAHQGPVAVVAYSPDGARLVSGGIDHIAILWDANSGEQLLAFRGHTDTVWGAAFSPDGKHVATASRDGTGRVWETASGKELLKLSGHSSTVVAIFYSPDGEQLATTSRDGIAKLWDASNSELLLNLYGDGGGLIGVAISSDGLKLATASQNALRLYFLDLSNLVTLAKSRLTRSLTAEECQVYLHVERCPEG